MSVRVDNGTVPQRPKCSNKSPTVACKVTQGSTVLVTKESTSSVKVSEPLIQLIISTTKMLSNVKQLAINATAEEIIENLYGHLKHTLELTK